MIGSGTKSDAVWALATAGCIAIARRKGSILIIPTFFFKKKEQAYEAAVRGV